MSKCQGATWNGQNKDFEYNCRNPIIKGGLYCINHADFNPKDMTDFNVINECLLNGQYNENTLVLLIDKRNNILLKNNQGSIPLVKDVKLFNKDYVMIESFSLIDAENYDEFIDYKWFLNSEGYCETILDGKPVLMHNLVVALDRFRNGANSKFYIKGDVRRAKS